MTMLICDEIRADAGDLVSEELRKRAAQCIQISVIRQWFGFLAVKYFIYRIPHIKSNQIYLDTTSLKKMNQGCLQYRQLLA